MSISVVDAVVAFQLASSVVDAVVAFQLTSSAVDVAVALIRISFADVHIDSSAVVDVGPTDHWSNLNVVRPLKQCVAGAAECGPQPATD
jgi:hypothetical protein